MRSCKNGHATNESGRDGDDTDGADLRVFLLLATFLPTASGLPGESPCKGLHRSNGNVGAVSVPAVSLSEGSVTRGQSLSKNTKRKIPEINDS